MVNYLQEFHTHSHSFLKLIASKTAKAKNNLTLKHELAELELFYDGCYMIIQNYEDLLTSKKLENIISKTMFQVLQNDYEKEFRKKFNAKAKPIHPPREKVTSKAINETLITSIRTLLRGFLKKIARFRRRTGTMYSAKVLGFPGVPPARITPESISITFKT